MSESTSIQSQPNNLLLWPIVDLAGYSCFVAWVFVQEFSYFPITLGGAQTNTMLFVCRLAFFVVSLLIAIVLPFCKSKVLIPQNITFSLIAAFVATLFTFAKDYLLSDVWVVLSWAVLAVCQCILFFFWICRLVRLEKRQRFVCLCGSFIVGALFILLYPLLDTAASIFTAFLPISTGVLLFASWKLHPRDKPMEKSSKTLAKDKLDHFEIIPLYEAFPKNNERMLLFRKLLFIVIYTTVFGLMIAIVINRFVPSDGYICFGLAGLAGALCSTIIIRYQKKKAYGSLPQIITWIVPVGLLLIAFSLNGPFVFVPLLIMCAVFQGMRLVDCFSASEYADISPSRYFWEFWMYFIGKAAGFALGWCLGFLMFMLVDISSIGYIGFLFALTVVIDLVYTIVFKRMKTSFSEILENDEMIVRVKMASVDGDIELRPAWKDVCAALAEKNELSPRQTEVFMLLAKGRNISFISDELVLSIPTVKTHIHNVYQKLGVHSQQELLNYIETAASES